MATNNIDNNNNNNNLEGSEMKDIENTKKNSEAEKEARENTVKLQVKLGKKFLKAKDIKAEIYGNKYIPVRGYSFANKEARKTINGVSRRIPRKQKNNPVDFYPPAVEARKYEKWLEKYAVCSPSFYATSADINYNVSEHHYSCDNYAAALLAEQQGGIIEAQSAGYFPSNVHFKTGGYPTNTETYPKEGTNMKNLNVVKALLRANAYTQNNLVAIRVQSTGITVLTGSGEHLFVNYNGTVERTETSLTIDGSANIWDYVPDNVKAAINGEFKIVKVFVKKDFAKVTIGKHNGVVWGDIIVNGSDAKFVVNKNWDNLVTDILVEMEQMSDDVKNDCQEVVSAISTGEFSAAEEREIFKAMSRRVAEIRQHRIALEALTKVADGTFVAAQLAEEDSPQYEAVISTMKQFNSVAHELSKRDGESITHSAYFFDKEGNGAHIPVLATVNAYTKAVEEYLIDRKIGGTNATTEKRFLEQYIKIAFDSHSQFGLFLAKSGERKFYRPWGSDDLFVFDKVTRCYTSILTSKSISEDEFQALCPNGDYVVFRPGNSLASAGNQKNKVLEIMGDYHGKDESKRIPWQLICNDIMHGAIAISQDLMARGMKMSAAKFSEFAVRLAMGKAPYRQFTHKPHVVAISLNKAIGADGNTIASLSYMTDTLKEDLGRVIKSLVQGFCAQSRDENHAGKGVVMTFSDEFVEYMVERLSLNGRREFVLTNMSQEDMDDLHEIIFNKGKGYFTESDNKDRIKKNTLVILYENEKYVGQTPDIILDMNALKTATNIEQIVGGIRILSVLTEEHDEMVLSTQLKRSLDLINNKVVDDWVKGEFYKTAQKLWDKTQSKGAKKLAARDLREAFEDNIVNPETGEVTPGSAKDIDWEELASTFDPATVLKIMPSAKKKLHDQNLKKLFRILNGCNYPVRGRHFVLAADPAKIMFGRDVLGLRPNGDLEVYINQVNKDDEDYSSISHEEVKERIYALTTTAEGVEITQEQKELCIAEFEAIHPGVAVVSTKEYIARTGEGWDFDGDTIYIFILEIAGQKVKLAIRYPKTHLRGFFILEASEAIRKNKIFKTICVHIEAQPIGDATAEADKIYNTKGSDTFGLMESAMQYLQAEFENKHANVVELASEGYTIESVINGDISGSAFLGSTNYAVQLPKQVGEVIVMFTPLVDLLNLTWILKNDQKFQKRYQRDGRISLAAAAYDLTLLKTVASQNNHDINYINREVEVTAVKRDWVEDGDTIWALDTVLKTVRTIFKVKSCGDRVTLENYGYKGYGFKTYEKQGQKYFDKMDANRGIVKNTINGNYEPTNPTITSEEGIFAMSAEHKGNAYVTPLEYSAAGENGLEIDKVVVTLENAVEAMQSATIYKIEETPDGKGIWSEGFDNMMWLDEVAQIALDFNAIIRFYGEGTIDQVKKPVASMMRGIFNEIGMRAARLMSRKRKFGAQIYFDNHVAKIKYGVDKNGASVVTVFNKEEYEATKVLTSTVHKEEKDDGSSTGYKGDIVDGCFRTAQKNLEVIENYAKCAINDLNNTKFGLSKAELKEMVNFVCKGLGVMTPFLYNEVGQAINVLTNQWLNANKAIELRKKEIMSLGISEKSDTFRAILDQMKSQKKVVFATIINTANCLFEKLGIANDPIKVCRLLWVCSAMGRSFFTNRTIGDVKLFRNKIDQNFNTFMVSFAGPRFLQWIISIGQANHAELGDIAPEGLTYDKLHLVAWKGLEDKINGIKVVVKNGVVSYKGEILAWTKDTELNGEFEIKTEVVEEKITAYLTKAISEQLPKVSADFSKVSLQLHEYVTIGNEKKYLETDKVLAKVAGKEVYLVMDRTNACVAKRFGLFAKTADGKMEFLGGVQGCKDDSFDKSPVLRDKVYGGDNKVMKGKCFMAMKSAWLTNANDTIINEDGIEEQVTEQNWHKSVLVCLEDFTTVSDEEKTWALDTEVTNVATMKSAAEKGRVSKQWLKNIKTNPAGLVDVAVKGCPAKVDEKEGFAAINYSNSLYVIDLHLHKIEEVVKPEDIKSFGVRQGLARNFGLW